MRFVPVLLIPILLALFLFIAGLAGADNSLDQRIAEDMKELAGAHASLRHVMIGLTHSGGIPMMATLALVGAAVFVYRRRYWLALAWVVIMAGGGLLDLTLKQFYFRDRPPEALRDSAVTETNKSFPSGHSMGSTIGYGMLAYAVCLAAWPRSRRILTVAALTLLVAAIGFSRIFLRAHWLTDVLGGFTIGLAWLVLCVTFLEMYRRRRHS
jgi:membrane-associated phospholipid phosphatase